MTTPIRDLTLFKAATDTVAAIKTGDMPTIQAAGEQLSEALKVGIGRKAKCTDEEFRKLDHLTPAEAAKILDVTPDAVYRRRRKLRRESE